jgi:hypothetical protein
LRAFLPGFGKQGARMLVIAGVFYANLMPMQLL